MKKIALIPARGGSKRIPKKNIKDFLGKPVISYPIKTAIDSKLFDEVMVSTDSEEIADIAIKYGAKVPFMRSNETANDFATTADVIFEVIGEYKKQNTEIETVCCIYPATPLLKNTILIESYKLFKEKGFETLFPTAEFSNPIQRALKITDSKILMFNPEYINSRSQDLEKAYYDAGQFYWIKTEPFLKNKLIYTNNSGTIVLPNSSVQDIDNESDWIMAELKYKILNDIYER